jgi:hypothetical protein
MATQLGLYNAALIEIGERTLASLSEAREPRRVLDSVYANVVTECLEAGQWNFAIRSVRAEADPAIAPEFGERNIFAKPADWLRTVALSANDRFTPPLASYLDEVGYWAADIDPIFVRYVSSDPGFGLNLAAWPRSFTRYVELALAERIVERLAQNRSKKDGLAWDMKKARLAALGRDAMNEAQPKFAPAGSWNAARGGKTDRQRREV